MGSHRGLAESSHVSEIHRRQRAGQPRRRPLLARRLVLQAGAADAISRVIESIEAVRDGQVHVQLAGLHPADAVSDSDEACSTHGRLLGTEAGQHLLSKVRVFSERAMVGAAARFGTHLEGVFRRLHVGALKVVLC